MDNAIQPPSPELSTSEFALRLFTLDDVPAIMAAGRDPLITRHTFMPREPDEERALAWIERSVANWERGIARFAVHVADDPAQRCVGQAGLLLRDGIPGNAEAVYWLLGEVRGRRWAAQALALICRWAFDDLDIERVEVLVDIDNDASQKTAEAAGFTREGILRGYERVPDRGRVDLWSFSRLATD